MRTRLWPLAALVAATLARADTIETKDGQRLEGAVVAETPDRLTLRGKYGELSVAKADIARRERDAERLELSDGSVVLGQVLKRTDAEVVVRTAHGTLVVPAKDVKQTPRAPVDPQRLQALHRDASRSHGAKDYRKALELYRELLALAPDDATALYNTACGHSLLGEKAAALSFLEKAIVAGFTDFGHIRTDTDLDPLRAEPGYLALLADEPKFLRGAAAGATTRLLAQLKGRGCKADYRVFVDEERSIVYLHTKSQQALDASRKELDDYARLQWRDLFRNKLTQPLHVVLLTREDGPAMLERGIGGYFDPRTNVLICGDIPSMAQARASVVTHEFTHALHFADQAARGQPHPIWLVEGLGSLFESATVKDDRLVPRHGARLSTIKAAVRRDQALPWRRIMQLSHTSFMEVADLAYAQSRYMCFYMWERGLLKRFYDEYTQTSSFQGDRTALESFEIAFGRPIDEVERDWKAWVLKQEEPKVPFMGVRTEATLDGCRVEVVVDGSAAAKAGVQVGDVLTSADGTPLRAPDDVLEVLSTREVGDVVELELRRGEATLRLKVTLGGRQ